MMTMNYTTLLSIISSYDWKSPLLIVKKSISSLCIHRLSKYYNKTGDKINEDVGVNKKYAKEQTTENKLKNKVQKASNLQLLANTVETSSCSHSI